MTTSKHQPEASDAPPRKPARRRYWLAIPILLLLLAGVVAAAPALVSSSWGRNAALDWLNQSIPGEIRLQSLSLSWLGEQSLAGLAIHDAQGQPVMTLDALTTDLSLVEALRGRLTFGETVLQRLQADLVINPDGTTNLANALGGTGDAGGDGGAPLPVTSNMALIDSRVSLAAPGIESVALTGLSGAVEMTDRAAPLKLSFGGRSTQGELEGSITLNGQITELFDGATLQPGNAKADVNATIEDLPVDALDGLLGAGGALSALIGDRATLDLQAKGDAAQQDLRVAVQAPRADLQLRGSVRDGAFSLAEPASARLELTPAAVDAINRLSVEDSVFQLADSVPFHLDLAQLDFPMEPFELSRLALRGALEARGTAQFIGIREIGEAAVTNLKLAVDSPGLGDTLHVELDGEPETRGQAGTLSLQADVRQLLDEAGQFQPGRTVIHAESAMTGIPTSLVDSLLQQDGLLVDAIGPQLDISLSADTDESDTITAVAAIDATHLQSGPLRFTIDEAASLAEAARLQFSLTPALWQRFGGDTRLQEPVPVTLSLSELHSPLPGGGAPWRPADTRVAAELSSGPLAIHTGEDGAPTRLEGLTLKLAGESLAALQANGTASVAQSPGVLEALDAAPAGVRFEARTGLTEAAGLKEITARLELDSPGLNGSFAVLISEGLGHLSLREPATVEATLSPALLGAGGDGAVTLRDAAPWRATLEELSVPLAPFSQDGVVARGSAEAAALDLQAANGAVTAIRDAQASFTFNGADQGRAELNIDAAIRAGDAGAGELTLSVVAGNLLSAGGEALSLDLQGRLEQLPTALADQLLSMDGLLVATLGATTNFNVDAQLENRRGPVSLSLNAANTRADMAARLGDRGLTLDEPLVAELEPTPELGKQVLAKIHPIFETTQSAEQPIRLEVPAEGVLLPVGDFDFSGIVVPRMTLAFGKLSLKSGWLLRSIVGLGQQFGSMESTRREQFEAWFTPAVLEIGGGRIQYSRRLDLLLERRLHLATWGSADVSADRAELILAFMPNTMERIFSITVAEGDALHIPITGPLSAPKADFKKIAADLARLRAQEEAAGESPLAGALLGALGGKATGRSGPVPEPSVSPLPWAALLEAQEADGEAPAGGQTEPQQGAQEQAQPEQPAESPSTEERVIRGLMDMLGNDQDKQ